MQYTTSKVFVSILAVILLVSVRSVSAQEDWLETLLAHTDSDTRCLNLREIDDTEILDLRNIVFHMKNNAVYLNHLPYTCPGLSSSNPFMYRVTINRLCSMDVITMLDQLGSGFIPGASCGLGQFHLIDEELLGKLKQRFK
jgi:hypothetical protein